MTESIPVISVRCDQIVPSPANKRKGRLLRIEELAESIRLHGLMQEPLVRPIPNDTFEIVAGERRWRACCLIGDTISVKVRELTDAEAHELTFAENHDREDLEPIEEAEFIQVMLDDGKSPEEIAGRFGRSVQWVAKRSKLINLTPHVKELLQGEVKTGIAGWPATHLELLARFDHHIQNAFLKQFDHDGTGTYASAENLSLSDLKDDLDSYLMKLSSVPWKLEDEQLLETAGSCTNCQKRTSLQTSLFDQVEEKGKVIDQCIDKDCWSEKYKRFIEQRKATLAEKNPDLILIDASNYSDSVLDDDDTIKENAVRQHNVVDCRKSDPGAKQALVIDGRGAGTTKWVRPLNTSSQSSSGSGGPKSLEERYEGLTRKRLFQVLNSIIAILKEEIDTPKLITHLDDESAMLLALIWGCRRLEGFSNISATEDFDVFDTWKNYDIYAKQNKSKDYFIDLVRCVLPGWREILEKYSDAKTYSGMARKSQTDRVDEAKKHAERICKILKVDFEELVRQAELEIKTPKSWEKLNDDGTKKESLKSSDELKTESDRDSIENDSDVDNDLCDNPQKGKRKPAKSKKSKKKISDLIDNNSDTVEIDDSDE